MSYRQELKFGNHLSGSVNDYLCTIVSKLGILLDMEIYIIRIRIYASLLTSDS